MRRNLLHYTHIIIHISDMRPPQYPRCGAEIYRILQFVVDSFRLGSVLLNLSIKTKPLCLEHNLSDWMYIYFYKNIPIGGSLFSEHNVIFMHLAVFYMWLMKKYMCSRCYGCEG